MLRVQGLAVLREAGVRLRGAVPSVLPCPLALVFLLAPVVLLLLVQCCAVLRLPGSEHPPLMWPISFKKKANVAEVRQMCATFGVLS